MRRGRAEKEGGGIALFPPVSAASRIIQRESPPNRYASGEALQRVIPVRRAFVLSRIVCGTAAEIPRPPAAPQLQASRASPVTARELFTVHVAEAINAAAQ